MSEFMRGLQAFERLVKSDEGVRTGSCGKCGGSGHLTYECRNMIKLDAPAAKPMVNSRFGFLRKQLPGASSPTIASSLSTAGGSGKKVSDSRSKKDEKSSSRHKKKRRGSVSSNSSGSDSDSASEDSDSSSRSESDSEEEPGAVVVVTTRAVGIVGLRGIVQRTEVDVAVVMIAHPDHHIIVAARLRVHPHDLQDAKESRPRGTDLILVLPVLLEDDRALLLQCVPQLPQFKTVAKHGENRDQDRGPDLPQGSE
ncbi:hypothetical protein BGZ97_006785 [Linnemannia gamsii]|uniref:CCHC-type domain-containing protein n=1 Tax=Linnemannia gamsii TaxID=64522 RepID=A0A9P6RLI3_9FUNG|nr:hypothetical protein BGZ97_006785 [Linnemannia gamsii]